MSAINCRRADGDLYCVASKERPTSEAVCLPASSPSVAWILLPVNIVCNITIKQARCMQGSHCLYMGRRSSTRPSKVKESSAFLLYHMGNVFYTTTISMVTAFDTERFPLFRLMATVCSQTFKRVTMHLIKKNSPSRTQQFDVARYTRLICYDSVSLSQHLYNQHHLLPQTFSPSRLARYRIESIHVGTISFHYQSRP